MDHTSEELDRINAIQRYIKEGERPVDVYSTMRRSKKWFYKWLNRYKSGRDNWFKDLPKKAKRIPNKTNEQIELVIVETRKLLMDGVEESVKYSCVGAEAIQYHMEKMGYSPSEIPSLSTIKRIIKHNKLKVNRRERYKRVRSKGRYTIIKPKYIDEMHQIDFVGPRYIKGFGPINSLHLRDVVGRGWYGQQYIEKSMDNVLDFLLKHWKKHPIPKFLQVDNGMCFIGDFKHPKSFSRFVRLALYLGIEVIFIAPSKPWMNGSVESANGEFDSRFWKKEEFNDLKDIRRKSRTFYKKENEFNEWKLRGKNLKHLQPIRRLKGDVSIDRNNIPLVTGKVHFIRVVNSEGEINVLNEFFGIGKAYTGEYIWATIDTRKELLTIQYNDENLVVQKITSFSFEIDEKVGYRKHSILKMSDS